MNNRKRPLSQMSGYYPDTSNKYMRMNDNRRIKNENRIDLLRRDIIEIKEEMGNINNQLKEMRKIIENIEYFVGMRYKKFKTTPSYFT